MNLILQFFKNMRTMIGWQDTIVRIKVLLNSLLHLKTVAWLTVSGRYVSNQVINANFSIVTDGTQILIAVADRVFIYDANSGEMVKQARGTTYQTNKFILGHKDTIYCIAYSKDG